MTKYHYVHIHIVGLNLTTISFRNYTTFEDTTMFNVLTSPPLDIPFNHGFEFVFYFDVPSNLSQIHLYMTSSLGHPKTKLLTVVGSDVDNRPFGIYIRMLRLCIPAGQYQLAFVAFLEQSSYPDQLLSIISTKICPDSCSMPSDYPTIPQYGMRNICLSLRHTQFMILVFIPGVFSLSVFSHLFACTISAIACIENLSSFMLIAL